MPCASEWRPFRAQIHVFIRPFLAIIAGRFFNQTVRPPMVNDKQILLLEILKELVWLGISVLIAMALMYPIYTKVHYNQIWLNGLFLVIAFTYFRYAITLRSVYVLRNKWVKAVILLFNINFFIFILRQEQRFMTIYDSFTIDDLGLPVHPPLPLEQTDQLFRYFFTEINFAVVACLGMIVALSVRFIWSYWKTAYQRLNAGDEQ
jgi:hypothetical protein